MFSNKPSSSKTAEMNSPVYKGSPNKLKKKEIVKDSNVDSVKRKSSNSPDNSSSSSLEVNGPITLVKNQTKNDHQSHSNKLDKGKTIVKNKPYQNGDSTHKYFKTDSRKQSFKEDCNDIKNLPRKNLFHTDCSDVSSDSRSPKKQSSKSDKAGLFVQYKGKLYPVKCMNKKYTYSHPLHIHHKSNDDHFRERECEEKPELSNDRNLNVRKSKFFKDKGPPRKFLNQVYISSDESQEETRYDFPNERAELKYYHDMEKYRKGYLRSKPLKEHYQTKIILPKEKRKSFQHPYEDKKLRNENYVSSSTLLFDDREQIENDAVNISKQVESDPECMAAYWKFKYLFETKFNKRVNINIEEKVSPAKTTDLTLKNTNRSILANRDVVSHHSSDDEPIIVIADNNSIKHKNRCKISLEKGKDTINYTYLMDTQKMNNFTKVLQNLHTNESTRTEQVKSDHILKNRNHTNEPNENEISSVATKEKEIFDKIKNEKLDSSLSCDEEERSLFNSSELEQYLKSDDSEKYKSSEDSIKSPSKISKDTLKSPSKTSKDKVKNSLKISTNSVNKKADTKSKSKNSHILNTPKKNSSSKTFPNRGHSNSRAGYQRGLVSLKEMNNLYIDMDFEILSGKRASKSRSSLPDLAEPIKKKSRNHRVSRSISNILYASQSKDDENKSETSNVSDSTLIIDSKNIVHIPIESEEKNMSDSEKSNPETKNQIKELFNFHDNLKPTDYWESICEEISLSS